MTFGIVFLLMVAAMLNLLYYDYAWVALLLLIVGGVVDVFALNRR